MSKPIYEPAGRAAEFSKFALNLFNGCSHGCEYCFNKIGVAKNLLGKDDVTPKKVLVFDLDIEKEPGNN